MTVDFRTLETCPEELPGYFRTTATAFLLDPRVTAEDVAVRRQNLDLARTRGAFEDGRCVATFRTFAQRLTVPGGTTVASCAVSGVTVSPSHRRRGLLTRMMADAMSDAKERGEAVASLVAAEYPIYGRYGYGPATWAVEHEVDVVRGGLDPRWAGPDDGGRVDLAGTDEVLRVGPELHERFRRQPDRQGAIDRDAYWWRRHTGEARFTGDGWEPRLYAVHRDADGRPQGLVSYQAQAHWDGGLPDGTAQVHSLIATTPEAERALWRFLLSLDLVTRVRSGLRAPDDLLPRLLTDPRAARVVSRADWLWLRPLDVPALLRARAYAVPGRLVLDVRDEAGLADGRFLLEAGPDGASCAPTRREPDLTTDVGTLGSLLLGEETVTRLVALGAVAEDRPGAAALADPLLRTARRPWCPDQF